MKAIFLAGVTGSGKTEVALYLSKHHKIHIINCDSVQIYNKLHILSNKPQNPESHSILDFYSFDQQYDITKYVEDVNKEIDYCLKNNKIPLIVGGTGFYFSKLHLLQFKILKIFLTQKREILYNRLDDRCERMVMCGMLDEVEKATEEGLRADSILGKAIGCRDALVFLDECRKEPEKCKEHFVTFLKTFKRRTRNYARKQECWFRKTDFVWLDIDKYDARLLIDGFLKNKCEDEMLHCIDRESRDCNNNARKIMKTFVSSKGRVDQMFEEVAKKYVKNDGNKP